MSVQQNRLFSGSGSSQMMSPAGGNFVQPAPPSSVSNVNLSSSSLSSSLVHRHHSPRDPFTLSAPPSTTVSTLPGTGGLFLTPSVNSHQGFTPTRSGGASSSAAGAAASGKQGEAPVLKPPKPPEKPLMPYMRYSRRMWEKVRTANPDSKLWDIGKIIGQMWRELPDASRQVYVDEYEAEKVEYDKALKTYHNSPAYQAYMQSKNRSRGGEKAAAGSSVGESGVFIQPVDEDEGDMGQFSIKQVAASRFHRNHRLMKEIFGEAQVPDTRNVITAHRLGVLKKQVNSLTLHQNKLEEELKQLEAKFDSKKRKMSESSNHFSTTLKKICSHKMEPFEELVERSKAYLLSAYEKYKIQEQKQNEVLLESREVESVGDVRPAPTPAPTTTTTDLESKTDPRPPQTAAVADQPIIINTERQNDESKSEESSVVDPAPPPPPPPVEDSGAKLEAAAAAPVADESVVGAAAQTTTSGKADESSKQGEVKEEEEVQNDGSGGDDAVIKNKAEPVTAAPHQDAECQGHNQQPDDKEGGTDGATAATTTGDDPKKLDPSALPSASSPRDDNNSENSQEA